MSQTIDIIKQSHKTILFEEFSDSSDKDAPSLSTIIDKYLSMERFGSEEFYREIEQKLTVYTFEEFVERFAPKIYEYVESVDGIPYFRYITDEKEAKEKGLHSQNIVDHPFFKMLEQTYSQKGSSGLSNLDFPLDRIKTIFTPKAQMEDVYRMRKTVRSLSIDYEKAKQTNQDAKPFALGLRKCRQEIRNKFENSTIACLALAIEEGDKKINELRSQIKNMEKQPDGIAPVLQIGRIGFDPDGSLVVRPISVNTGIENASNQKAIEEDKALRKTLALIEGDIKKVDSVDQFTKDLVISVYAPSQICRGETAIDLPTLRDDLASLERQRECYINVYKQAQEAFIASLTKSAQKLLDVLVFFDHATVKGGRFGKLPAGLIVTNCKTSSLIKDSTSQERLKRIMEKLGHASGNSKVWLAILPDIAQNSEDDNNAKIETLDAEEILNSDLDYIPDIEENIQSNAIPFDLAKNLLNIMDECCILTIFNFIPDKKNTFAGINADAVQEFENNTAILEGNRHAVITFPNFTLIGEGNIDLSGQTINVGPIHISASYVATGLIAASQQENVLMSKGLEKEVKRGSACVRVDLEDTELTRCLATKINRELAFRWDADIIQAITKNRFGFVFCCDQKSDPKTGKSYNTSYILQTRSFEKEDGRYQPLYRTLTLDYIESYLNEYGHDSQDAINRLKLDADEWVKDSGRNENKEKINLILRTGEKIEEITEGDNVSILINFNEGKASLRTAIKAKTNKRSDDK